MPFKKPATRANLQPIDARKIFIGRRNELYFFIHDILEPDEPTHNIVSISGQGGVGKSTLVNRFIDEAHATNFKDYCFTALVNERQITPTSIMERFAEQLHLEGDFKKALSQYKETVYKLRSEREAMRDVFLNKAPGLAGTMLEDIPVAGKLLKEGTEAAAEYFITRYRSQQLLKDAERLEDPIGDLTSAFVKELNLLADTPRTRHQRHVILFFDTFEQLAPDVAPWLLDHFLEADVSSNVILVVAGRDSIEDSTPEDPKRWLPYLDAGTIHFIPLNIFDEEETRAYLQERGITDLTQVTQLWHLSRGLPLYLGILTSNPHGKVDPTANVVDNFLRWIPEQDKIKRRLALDASLFTMPFNKDDLSAFHYLEQERDALFSWLISQPFIRSNPQDGRYTYHEIAQELFSRYLYQRSSDECCETRRTLVRLYQKRLENTEKDGGAKVYKSTRWQELALALAQQLFFLPDESSHLKGFEQIFTAYYHCKSEQEGEIARVLREICKEEKIFQISRGAREIASQLLVYIEAEIGSEEFLNAANYVLGKFVHIPSFPAKLLASIYKNKGENCRLRGELQYAIADLNRAIELNPNDTRAFVLRGVAYYSLKDYQHAIVDFDCAIELNPKYDLAFLQRGVAYSLLKDYQHAIADLDHAIALNPDYGWAFAVRGEAYHLLKDYQHAIADLDCAIGLHPNYALIIAQRGEVYRLLKDYQHAIADLDRAIALNPNYSWAYSSRGQVYSSLKDYQHAISDFDRAIALNPDYSWVYGSRSQAYSSLKDYQHALSDLNHALDLNPNDVRAFALRGETYRLLEDYQLAIADFDRALAVGPNDNWALAQRGETYRLLKDYQRAIADFDRAIALDPNYAWVYGRRGQVYSSLKDYQHTLSDFDQAITLNPNNAWAYCKRGYIHLWLKDLQSARSDFEQSCSLDLANVNYSWMVEFTDICCKKPDVTTAKRLETIAEIDLQCDEAYVCKAVAQWLRGSFEQALAELDQALSIDPELEDTFFWKGIVYASLEQDEAAIAAIEKALELELPPVLLAPLRWFEQDRPEFYAQHVVPLLARFT